MQLTAKANTLCLLEILKDYTDSNHTLKMSEIISKMESIYLRSSGERYIAVSIF